MKRLIYSAILIVALLIPAFAVAKKVNLIKIGAEKGYEIVRFEIEPPWGAPDFFYFIDPQTCICFMLTKSENAAAVGFDCKKLKKIPELEKHVKQCE